LDGNVGCDVMLVVDDVVGDDELLVVELDVEDVVGDEVLLVVELLVN